MKRFIRAPMTITLAIVVFFLLTSLLGFYSAIKPPKIVSRITPADLGLAFEKVSFITRDDITLSGWHIPAHAADAKTIVLLHGYPADKGDILPSLSFLAKTYNLFLFDFRHLGESTGAYSTVGAKEVEDMRAALRFLASRGVKEVGVWGFSMGGAVALMAAQNAPEIQAVVSEASYASLAKMAPELYRIPLARRALGFLTGAWANVFLGIDIKKVSPEESAKNITIPVLVVHSKNDTVIPFDHALRMQDALKNNPRAEFWFEENLAHGQLGSAYQTRVKEFFEKNL